MSAEAVIVEKLDVHKGDIILVLVPEDMDPITVDGICESFGLLAEEHDAFAFIAPNTLRFKVVHEEGQ